MAGKTLTLKYRDGLFGGFNGVLVGEDGSSLGWVSAPDLQRLEEAALRCAPEGAGVTCVRDDSSRR